MILGQADDEGMDGLLDVVKKGTSVVTGAAKTVAKTTTSAARSVASATTSAARTAAGGAAKVASGAKTYTPWGGKGWLTRLGQDTSVLGLGPIGIACNVPRYRNSSVCKTAKSVTWAIAKQAIEKSAGLPPGSIDAAEQLLNSVGTDPKKREAAKVELRKKLPADVVELADERTRTLSWWEKLLSALGL